MNDEIKTILNYLETYKNLEEGLLKSKDKKMLLDYITNLQQEIQKKDAYIKYLEEYNSKYYKGEKFYGIEGDDKNV